MSTAVSISQPMHAIKTPITAGSSIRPTERPSRAIPLSVPAVEGAHASAVRLEGDEEGECRRIILRTRGISRGWAMSGGKKRGAWTRVREGGRGVTKRLRSLGGGTGATSRRVVSLEVLLLVPLKEPLHQQRGHQDDDHKKGAVADERVQPVKLEGQIVHHRTEVEQL